MPVWYPRRAQLVRALSPHFHYRYSESLGLFLPPSELKRLVGRFPRTFATLSAVERATARLTAPVGDHFIAAFQRRR
jgi:hypothetical protein